MTKQEIECHFLQWALSVNILGFSCLSCQPYLCISANFLLATSERQLQILMQIYTELILDLSVKEWSTIKVFEAASAAHLNWSNGKPKEANSCKTERFSSQGHLLPDMSNSPKPRSEFLNWAVEDQN